MVHGRPRAQGGIWPMSRIFACILSGLLSLTAPAGSLAVAAGGNSWEGTPQQAFLQSPVQQKFQCVICHTITDQGGTVGPVLNLAGLRRSKPWLVRWLENPGAVKPGTLMPQFPMSPEERESAAEYLSRMTRPLHTSEILSGPNSIVEKGRALFEDYDCRACHRIGDKGRFVGPDLTFVGIRKTEAWERLWLKDPPGFKPGTFMPNFEIPQAGINVLAAYLHTLQGQENESARAWEEMMNLMTGKDEVARGEMVWKRLACWSCHGAGGQGGVPNPNAASGHETVPGMGQVGAAYTKEKFLEKMSVRSEVPAAEKDVVPQPYFSPAYPENALNGQEQDDLWAYVTSLAR